MIFDKAVFDKIEGVGFRIRTVRYSRGLTVQDAHGDAMTPSAYLRSEDGRGGFLNLLEVCKKMGLSVKAAIEDKDGKRDIEFANLHTEIIKCRESSGISKTELARIMGVPYASVIVFERTDRPWVVTIGRFAEAIGVKLYLEVSDIHGPIVPSKRLAAVTVDKMRADYEILLKDENSDELGKRVGDELLKLRESKGLSRRAVSDLSKIKESRIQGIEGGKLSFDSATRIFDALGKKFEIYIGKAKVEPDTISKYLDAVRESRGISVSDFAKMAGTTYRTIVIFPRSSAPHIKSIQRYADRLGLEIDYRITDKD